MTPYIDKLVEEVYLRLLSCKSPRDAIVVLLAVHVKLSIGNIEVPIDIMLSKYCDAFREIYRQN